MSAEKPRLRAIAIVDELEALKRVLSDEESLLLERSLRRIGPKRDIWRWSARDDRKLILLIKKRGYSLRIKPFQKNDEVQRIANDMGRSYLAVLKRVQRLRARMEEEENVQARGKLKGVVFRHVRARKP